MTTLFRCSIVLICSLNFNSLFSQTIITVGPSGTYAKLSLLAAALNSGGVTTPTIVELQNNYDGTVGETFPVIFNAIPGASATNTIIIRPALNVTARVTSGAFNGALINFNGARWLTFDGRAGGVGVSQWSVINTSQTSTSNVVSFTNGAQNDNLRYMDIQGAGSSNANGPSGAIHFGGSATVSNSNILVDNCNIHNATGSELSSAITSTGQSSTILNELISISNNNIYDFHANALNTRGIHLAAFSNRWTISGNSFYQTTDRTTTSASNHIAISILSGSAGAGNEHAINGNFIGGKAPSCGGGAYTIQTGQGMGFHGIQFSSPTANAAIIIENNTIRNFNIQSSLQSNSILGFGLNIFLGILLNGNPAANNATINGNTIGSITTTGSITTDYITNGGESRIAAIGIVGTNTGTHTISNNNIGGFTLNSNPGRGHSFTGIWALGSSNLTITGNTVGGSVANSINLTGNAAGISQPAHGIWARCTSFTSVFNNEVKNITNENSSTVIGTTTGIFVNNDGGNYVVAGNTISNLSSKNIANGSNVSSTVVGIGFGAGTPANANNTISGNTIHSLSNLATGAPTAGNNWVLGINYQGGATGGTQIIENNFIHSLSSNLLPDNGASGILGINIFTGLNLIVRNNMIRLGINADGTSIVQPHRMVGIRQTAATASSIIFNSIYIGGSGITSGFASNSACIQRNVNSAAHVLRNNILVNERSNDTGNGFHLGFDFSLGTAGLTSTNVNNNLIRANLNGGHTGRQGANNFITLALWQSNTNFDSNSNDFNPVFVNATGNAALVNLHINSTTPSGAEGTGSISGLSNAPTTDFDEEVRAGLTPVDIGADAGNFDSTNEPTLPCNSFFNFQVVNCTTVNFTPASQGNNYVWNFGDASSPSNSETPVHVFANSGAFNVCLQVAGTNCTTTETCLPVNIENAGVITISSSNGTVLCPNLNTTLLASTGFISYLWNNGSTLPSIVVATAGTFSVTGTTQNGCTANSNSISITSIPPITSNITTTQTENFLVSFNSNALNATSYFWNFGDGNTSSQTSPTHAYLLEGTYNVTLTLGNECDTVTINQSVDVIKLSINDFYLNAISVYPNPASDLIFIDLKGFNTHDGITYKVFDILGNQLYLSQTINDQLVQINTSNWASGVYLLNINTSKQQLTRKIFIN